MSNTCNKTSNNKYFDCPARMDDGRIFTDYRPSSSVDDMIRYSNNVMSSYEYRQFLINNATNIMNVNMNYTLDKVGCGSCDAPTMPFHTECKVNNHFSRCDTIDSNGIGIYNKIENFDIKEDFKNERNNSMNKPNMNASSMNASSMNASSMNKPNMNASSMNKPNMNALSMNKPTMNTSSMNKPTMNTSSMNKPNMNTSNMNASSMNKPNMNTSNMNRPNMNR
jgi:hypothetical protein